MSLFTEFLRENSIKNVEGEKIFKDCHEGALKEILPKANMDNAYEKFSSEAKNW